MKATICKNALATLLLLCATGPIQAQEFVREVVNHKDSYSIVREINEKTWLVSNFHNGECVFTKIEDLNPITDQLYLNTFVGWDSSRVNDFVIFRDTVYFCGTIWFENDYQSAFWGYFPLAGFPNVPVKYTGPSFVSLNQIQVFSVDSSDDLHVVMVGEKWGLERNIGAVVEEMRISPYLFEEHYSFIYEDTNYFTDVIQTDSFIVVSSIKGTSFNMNSTYGRLLSIKKPVSPHISVFSNGGLSWKVKNVYSSILLAECEGNAFASAYKSLGGSILAVSGYVNGFQHYASVHLMTDRFNGLKDMSYSKDRKVLDILFNYGLFETTGSIIFHFDPGVLLSLPTTVPGLKYEKELLNSLTSLHYLQSGFIASGHDKATRDLRVYRYIEYLTGKCADNIREEVSHFEFKQEIIEIEIKDKIMESYLFDWGNSPKEIPIRVKCGE